MIKRYKLGNPFDTESVVKDLPVETGLPKGLNFDEKTSSFSRSMNSKTVIYGLGETTRGINKRGFKYRSFCSDDPNHDEDKESLYAAQNFFIIDDGNSFVGYYFDTPGIIYFDFGYTEINTMTVSFEEPNAYIYEITGESNLLIVKEFRGLIGRSYIPPKWAFGFGQSRWGYENEADVRHVYESYEKAGIPLDSIYMDIDYMERYKDFTIDETKFPKFEDFNKEMLDNGIHLVPIIDAGVKIEEGYSVYEEGVKNGYFVKKADGNMLVAAVWPGRSALPDFLNEEAREWFGNKYKFLLDKGIEGFWNDMNEPAIFYTEDHLNEVFDALDHYKGMNLDATTFFEMEFMIGSVANNMEDYKRFYHNTKQGLVRHDRVHNIYGFNMTRAAGEAFERLCPEKRILMFSRSSYIGMHRYGGIWTGDNKSYWGHLIMNVKQLPALNMCGFIYSGADTGGFGSNTTRDLMLRWLAVSIFTPLFRNHAARGTREQELYNLGDTKDFKGLVELRYSLIPYIYSEFMKAVLNDDMYFRPLAFEYTTDERAREIEDELLVGESLLIAPVTTQNVSGRMVYLPEDMKLIRFRSPEDYDEEIIEKGDHYVKADLNEVLVFLRPGHAFPFAKPAKRVKDIDYSTIKYFTYKAKETDYELYNDDGVSRIK